MNELKDGGPAFPVPSEDSGPGMSLRDWFAGQAIAGFACPDESTAVETMPLTAAGAVAEANARIRRAREACREAAEFAYMVADALLQARS